MRKCPKYLENYGPTIYDIDDDGDYTVTQRRDDDPAVVDRLNNGRKTPRWYLREEWRQAEFPHRKYGPALTVTNPFNGVVVQEEYKYKGRLHRLRGPAVIQRDTRTGEITKQEFWVRGRQVVPHYGPEDWSPF